MEIRWFPRVINSRLEREREREREREIFTYDPTSDDHKYR